MAPAAFAALAAAALLLGAAPVRAGAKAVVSPVQKTLELLSGLEATVIKEGEAAHKAYVEYSEWCEERSKNLDWEIKSAKEEVTSLKAAIEQASGQMTSLAAEIDDSANNLATNDADLKAASGIRAKEADDFAASEKELVEVVDALERAISILEREAKKGSGSMLQLKHATNIVQAIAAMVDASMLNSQDASTLTALVQDERARDDDEELGAPDAAVYASHSGSIIDTLEGLFEKAKDQLNSARKKEASSRHNFEMLKQSINDEMKFGNIELAKAKKELATQTELKAGAEGDLQVTSKALTEDVKTKGSLKQDCMFKARDYEGAAKSRSEELKALAEAKRAISEMTSGAEDLTYSLGQATANGDNDETATSFLQLRQRERPPNEMAAVQMSSTADGRRMDAAIGSHLRTGADLANFEAVRFIRNLARKLNSASLAQLAHRMAAAIRYSATSGADPFTKVKELIKGLLDNLEKAAQTEASHKAYCDKELGETLEKKADREAELSKLTASIDSMGAKSVQLKEQVADLQKALAELAKAQSVMTKVRQEEKAQFDASKPEIEQGLEGVKMALKVLRDYYAQEGKPHDASGGTASSIMALLEVVESDFSKNLAEMTVAETAAQSQYEQETQANEIQKTIKQQEVKYKTKEFKQLDGAVAEATSDRESVQTELSAIMDYKSHIQEMCIAKPESYGERKARREAEIAGLKEALSILEGESVLLQRPGRTLRGKRRY